jgi:hypothetical protein
MEITMNQDPDENQPLKIEIEVDAETAAEIEAIIQAEGWQPEEGFRLLLGAGLGYARGQDLLNQVLNGQLSEAEGMRSLLDRLCLIEGKLANARFRMHQLETENKRWNLSAGAIHVQNRILQEYNEKLKAENEALRAEIQALQEERKRT